MRPGSKFLAAACIWSFVATLPAQAVPATTEPLTPAEAEAACLREARWPIESAASYRHSDVRGKTQLRNTSSSQVRRMERVCRALTSTSQAERRDNADNCQKLLDQKRGASQSGALAHADRMKIYCDALRRP